MIFRSKPDSPKKLAKRFPQDYQLEMSKAEIEAFLAVLDALMLAYDYDHVTNTHVQRPEKVRAPAVAQRSLLELRSEELAGLKEQGRKKLSLAYKDEAGSETSVLIGRGEISVMALISETYAYLWRPPPGRPGTDPWQARSDELKRWNSHFGGLFGHEGTRYFNVLRERLRIALGSPTPCLACGGPVLPAQVTDAYGDSEAPVASGMCHGCLSKNDRYRRLGNNDHSRKVVAEQIAAEKRHQAELKERLKQRGKLP